MTSLAALLIGLVGPLVVRGLIALSFTAVVFTGVTEVVNSLVTLAQSNWSAMPFTVLQLITLSGIPQVVGMLFGAYMARVTMWAATGAARYTLKL